MSDDTKRLARDATVKIRQLMARYEGTQAHGRMVYEWPGTVAVAEIVERAIAAALARRMVVPRGWIPTAANVNALPEPFRRYIHDLEARCDPRGDIAHLAIQADAITVLQAKLQAAAFDLAAAQRPTQEA